MTAPTVAPTPESAAPARRLPRWLRWLVNAILIVIALFAFYLLFGWPWLSTWGATAEEAAMPLPGDDLVADAPLQTTRAITLRATPEEIYPWLVQMGVDRAGLYSYEGLENLVGLKVKNADAVHPEWQDTQPGDFMRYTPPGYAVSPGPGMWVVEMRPSEALITCNGMENEMPEPCTSSISYILDGRPDGSTRLIIRDRFTGGTGVKIWQAIPFIMERGQLRGLRDTVEASLGR